MNITQDVINDLLPLYFSDECSDDTRAIVDEYQKAHPEFAEEMKKISAIPQRPAIPTTRIQGNEMESLQRTKRLIRRRSFFMAFAIFCSLVPFSVLYTGGKTYWLFAEAPASAAFYAAFGIAFWTGYFVTKRKTRDI
jgi:hypothetical protein